MPKQYLDDVLTGKVFCWRQSHVTYRRLSKKNTPDATYLKPLLQTNIKRLVKENPKKKTLPPEAIPFIDFLNLYLDSYTPEAEWQLRFLATLASRANIPCHAVEKDFVKPVRRNAKKVAPDELIPECYQELALGLPPPTKKQLHLRGKRTGEEKQRQELVKAEATL